MNLIPTNILSSLPVDLIIGWGMIETNADYTLPFVDTTSIKKTSNKKRLNEHYSVRTLFASLVDYLGLELALLELKKTVMGKPYAIHADQYIFTSFSHSQDWVVCALSLKHDIGIDCELIDRKINKNVIGRIRSEAEKEMMQDVSDLEMWTMKEAFVKCIGTGIRMNLKNYPITKQEDRYVVKWQNEIIYIVPFKWQNHQLAVAWKK